ncbi:MAG TPA: SusC/RagA family TonB-linked outer membrane protein [Longimicrobiales bacterium]|nr:SusC/RagA family TonB-linked outer membrane protein [Longimicrobiales bacterium]
MDPRQQHSQRPLTLRVLMPLLAATWLAGGELVAQQTGNVSGLVVDGQSGLPISSAQIYIPDLDIGVLTQQNGRYLLLNVPVGTHTVRFERIGYRAQTNDVEVTPGGTAQQNFTVSEDALQLDEIIVTGTPGGTQRRAIGNAVARVDAEEILSARPIRGMQDLLQGRTPGVSFSRTGGQVGEGSIIRIRGVNSFGLGSQPLIYIDGVRMQNTMGLGPNLPNTGSGDRAASAFDDLNPNDIESIEIIKGPAAATLYGTEASAGVIQIITKRGAAGAPVFDAQITQGSNFVLNPRGMTGDQYRCTRVNATTGAVSAGSAPCNAADETLEVFNIFDLEDQNGFGSPLSNGHNQRYNLSVRGGTDQVSYFVSADYTDEEGVRPQTNWNEQFSGRANLSLVMNESLSADVSMGYITGDTQYGTGLIASGGLWPHIMWAQGRDPQWAEQYGTTFTQGRGYLSFTPEEFDIPEATRAYTRFTGSVTLSHNPISWLDHRLTIGIDRGEEESQSLFPRDVLGAAGPFGDASLGQVEILRPISTQMTFDYGASVRYSPVENFAFTTSVGAQYFTSELNRLETVGFVFPVPEIRSIDGATSKNAGQTFVQNKSLGLYVQQEIGWNDRVFVTGAIRGDDNSTFGADYDAAIYPKVAATWVLSEESFWNVGFINSLRLRGAWGKAGRQPNTFDAVTVFNPAVGSGGAAALTPDSRGNPNVGPEIGQELELGFDMALLDDRVSTEFTYFYQKTSDALVSVPLAPSDGFPGSQADNLGQLDNWGYEVGLNARVFEAGDWSFDLGGAFTYTMNEIKDLGGREPTTALRLGHPWPNLTSARLVSGEFSTVTGLPTNLMCEAGVSMAPDSSDPAQTAIYGWNPGGGAVDCATVRDVRILTGPTFSPWTWSLNGTMSWGNVQVFGLVDAEHGRWLNPFDVTCRHDYCGFPNSRESMQGDDPLFVASSRFWAVYPTDRRYAFDIDASYIRLREVGARYQLPENMVARVGAERASFSVAARNLWYLWKAQDELGGAKVPSPEIVNPTNEGAFSLFQWPPLSTVEATLRVTF